jgi:hypothetical protein
VTRLPSETNGAGLLRDTFGRRELTVRNLNDPLNPGDVPGVGTVFDADGREQVVITSQSGTTLSVSAIDVKGYGAIGDGSSHPLSARFSTLAAAQVVYPHAAALTDELDWAAWQGALNTAKATGRRVYAPAGTYIVHTTVTHPGGVHVYGDGSALDTYAATDAAFPQVQGTTVRLKAGVTVGALWESENFASLTGVATPDAHATPQHMGLHYLKLDANSIAGSIAWVARIYCKAFRQNDVDYVNGASGGLWGETQSGGYDMEWQSANVSIIGCGGRGLHARSLHDSQWTNLLVKLPSTTTPAGIDGVYIDPTGNVGGEQFTTCHVWGNYSNASWVLGSTNAACENCTADGTGIQILRSGNTFRGTIYGTNTPGQFVVKLGDGTARSIGENTVEVRSFNFKGSPWIVFTANVTDLGSRFRSTANMGAATRYQANGGVTRLTTAAATADTVLNVADTSFLPASGTVYGDDGTNRFSSITYTAKTATTLTGVAGIGAAGLANGAAIYVASDPYNQDSFELWDYGNPGSAGLLLERSTPAASGAHNAIRAFNGQIQGQEGVVVGSGGTQIKKHLSATVAWDPPSIAAGASATTTITVTGAALGDTVAVGFTSLVTGWTITGLVTATNTVEVRITNNTVGAVDLASGSLRADVWQH